MGFFKTKEEFVFYGSIEELEDKVFDLLPKPVLLADGLFAIFTTSDVGTLEGSIFGLYNFKSRMGMMLSFEDYKPGKLKLTFWSKTHIEHYFILLVFSLILAGILASGKGVFGFAVLTSFWIVAHLIFQWIINMQEKEIIAEVKTYLKLKRLKPKP